VKEQGKGRSGQVVLAGAGRWFGGLAAMVLAAHEVEERRQDRELLRLALN
jgi:putative copper export protein